MEMNKPEPKICQEDLIDGLVFICPRCGLYGPTVDKNNKCWNCGQQVDMKKEKFVKEKRKIKYLTEKQFKEYWDREINEFKEKNKF